MTNLDIPVIRKMVGGTEVFEFEGYTPDYLVKNFSDNPILVSFNEEITDTNSVKILPNTSEVVFVNAKKSASDCTETNKVYVQGAGEVEVRQLWQN